MLETWLRAYREAVVLPEADSRGKQAIVLHFVPPALRCPQDPGAGGKLGPGPDFATFAGEWLARVEPDIKPSTASMYRNAIRKFSERLAKSKSTALGSVSPEDAQGYYDSMFTERIFPPSRRNPQLAPTIARN